MKSRFEEELEKALRSAENNVEPLPGHEERFEMRLLHRQEDKKIRRMPRWPWIALAAACVAGAIVAISIREINFTNEVADSMKLSEVSTDMAEVEQFYNQRIQVDFSTLNQGDARIKRFMEDMKNLEEEYASLEKELARNYSNERVVKAMITNYQCRLRIMEHLQKYIEIQNELSKTNHEKQPIS